MPKQAILPSASATKGSEGAYEYHFSEVLLLWIFLNISYEFIQPIFFFPIMKDFIMVCNLQKAKI